ncbi:hypothetical protein M9Y10_005812 [Tritrichomonas musculus]|uniref:DUF3447 domain-containing protein n=1 Tax=Tritrichomonas musculus TaxID=1915356 RepID=A0ABR2JD37_9EUKA
MPIIDKYYTGTYSDNYDIEKRKCGENDSYIAMLIRNDYVEEFIKYINQTNYDLNSQINKSDFETNPFLNNRDPTLIEYAAFFGSIQIFQFLIKNNVKLVPSLWFYAIHGRNPDIIHILEGNNVKLNEKAYEFCIKYAIKCHHNDLARYLLDQKNQNICYFHYCLKFNNYEMMPIDLDSYSKFDLPIDQIPSLIRYDYDFFNLLFRESYLDINDVKDNKRLLSFAIEKNDIKLIKFLLSIPKINPNYIQRIRKNNSDRGETIDEEMTELSKAVENKNIELIKLLMKCPNIDPNIKLLISYGTRYETWTPLSMAIEMENTEIINILFSNEKTLPNANGELLLAIKKDNDEILKLLINDQRTDLNELSEEIGKTQSILFRAVEEKNIKLIKLLLDCPYFDPNVKFEFIKMQAKQYLSDEETPLSIAIENEDLEVIKLLLECPKIEPNKEKLKFIHHDYEGEFESGEKTELSIAIEKGNDEIIHLLFKNQRINPNTIFSDKNYQNRTILSTAVEEGNINLIKLLLECPNIDLDTKINKEINYNGETRRENTVLQLALYTKNRDVICLIFEHMKKKNKILNN